MKRFQIYSQVSTDYEIRTETRRGVEYWVVPVVMMVQGVHHGSQGPLLYTSEELGRVLASWNGIPITVDHPQDPEGLYVSANLPEFIEQVVGHVYNAQMDGDKLRAEAWIETSTLREVSGEAYEYIEERKALDVSVGTFSDEVQRAGDFQGERYRAVATNLRPDHLALLPGGTGACSWDDGCGIRANETKTKKDVAKEIKSLKELSISDVFKEGFGIHPIASETGYREIGNLIQQKLNQMDNDQYVYYLEEVFDNNFVYCVHKRTGGDIAYYRRRYSTKQDGSVDFQGEPSKVKKEVSFVNANSMTRTSVNKSITKQKEKMKVNNNDCSCKIDALIKNKATQYTEEDREWLETLEEERLDKIVASSAQEEEPTPLKRTKAPESNEAPKANADPAKVEESLVKKNADGSISINGKSLDEYIKESLSKESDTDRFIDNFMPDGLKGQLKTGLKLYQEKRATLIKGIVDNSKFKEDQLKTWTDADLEALYESVTPEGDYSAQGNGFSANAATDGSEEEMSAMTSFIRPVKVVEKETKK